MTTPLNRHKYWLCPYFKYDTENEMVGECGHVRFPLRTYANDYAENYCAGNWKECTVARYWTEFYEMIGDTKDDRKERTHATVKGKGRNNNGADASTK